MNLRRTAFFVAVSAASLIAADTGIQFAGVLTAGGRTRLALTDTARKTTTWVEPGDEFNGYTIARYDPKEEAIFIKKNGQETRIGLVAAKIPETTLENPSDIAPSREKTAAAIQSNLRQLATAARQYQLAHGLSAVSYADLVGPNKLIKELKPVAGENYSTLGFGQNVTAVSVTTADGTTVSFDLPPAPVIGSTNAAVAARPTPGADDATNVRGAKEPAPGATGATSTPPRAPTSVPGQRIAPTGRQAASPTYTIQGGDTWETISAATGVPVPQLRELNPVILEGSSLPAGQTIRVR
jgi:LysM repeat protein